MRNIGVGLIIAGVLFASQVSVALAAPSVSSTAGTFSNSQSITINGSSFGAKSTAAPFMWDNYESGTTGTNVAGRTPVVGPTWGDAVGGGGSTPARPVISNSVVRPGSTRSVFHDFNSNYGCSTQFSKLIPNTGDSVYFTYWWRIHKTSAMWSRNIKPWMEFGTVGSEPCSYIGFPNDPYSGSLGSITMTFEDSPTNPSIIALWGSTNPGEIQDEWIRIEMYLVQSTPSVANGTMQCWFHRPYAASPAIILELNGVGNEPTRTTSNTWNTWDFGAYIAHDDTSGKFLTIGAAVYTDDLYFDTTRARVEIGNAPTWSACTHREIQVPSAWSDSSITATVNLGSFTSGAAYLYVVDSTGAVSNAQPITVVDSGLPTVTIAATTPNASESGPTNGVFTVTRNGPTASPLTVNYAITGTAVNTTDYATLSGNVTIPAGSSTAAITVTPVDDTLVEGDETVILTVAGDANYTVGMPFGATVTIADNDAPSGGGLVVDFGSSAANNFYGLPGWTTPFLGSWNGYSSQGPAGIKGGDTGTFDAMGVSGTPRMFNIGDQIVVTWYNTGTTPLAIQPKVSLDSMTYYGNGAGTWYDMSQVTIPAGQSATTTYTIDANSAGTHMVVNACRMTTYANAMLCDKIEIWAGGIAPPNVTIAATTPNASETGPTNGAFTVTRTGATTDDLVVNLAISGTATNGTDYAAISSGVTIPAGSATAAVTIAPVDDILIEGDETVTLTVTPSASYVVSSPSSATITIADNDLAPSWRLGDTNADGKIDGIDLATLSQNWDPLGTAGSHTWAQGDYNGDGKIDGIDLATLSQNWDPLGTGGTMATVMISPTPPSASESGPTNGAFTVTRVGPTTSALAVNYAISGTATNTADYATLSGSVTIPAGAATAVIPVAPVNDTLVEGDETVVLTLAVNLNYIVGASNSATVTIADNDILTTTLLVDYGSTAANNVYGLTGWNTPTIGRYSSYNSSGPAGVTAGSTGNGHDAGIKGTSRAFVAGEKIVVTWYNTGTTSITFTPKVSVNDSQDYTLGTGPWYDMTALTLASHATGTTTYTIGSATAGNHTLVNICRVLNDANGLLIDKIEIQTPGTLNQSQSNVQTLSAPAYSSPSKGEGGVRVKPAPARRLVPWPTKAP